MSGSASISGLSSGLDTAGIISQLMQLEAVPQARMQTRVTTEQRAVNAMQTLNSRLASLATTVGDLTKPSAWSKLTTASSLAGVTVTAGSAATAGAFSVKVDQVATTHRLAYSKQVGYETPGAVPTSVEVRDSAGVLKQTLTTDGTLSGLVGAINDPAKETGLRATAVRVGTDGAGVDQYQLVVESTATGDKSRFTLVDPAAPVTPLLNDATVRDGVDALVTVNGSIQARSATNTFQNLAPGVDVTIGAAVDTSKTADIELKLDPAGTIKSVKSAVDAINSVLTEIDSLTSYNAATKSKGMLAGESSVRELRGQILASVFPTDGTSLADLGIQSDRTGRLVLDETKLSEAYKADPDAVQQRLTADGTGFLDRVADVATAASDKNTGTLTQAITGRTSTIDRLNDGIEAWDLRLELRRTALTRQFTSLETALNKMNSQSSWLAGQLSSLSTSGS
ncbi:hypothetical protein ASC64_16550 [Nocardioides sp. Root122]|uniref:flagellar filament capping protein FliD n=1 Tax=Nocardioides TaxID=1839 RepID=UPI00070295C6|nr:MULTISPECIES: flagellar filament capping protein FliD [Nocardioides]KQV63228.1 hypothetical protein ASC64_16550 [Nocardioides sp. Root122]MCK9824405.1 flagellar filament capping protein FliD [Nocardioides cavernae]